MVVKGRSISSGTSSNMGKLDDHIKESSRTVELGPQACEINLQQKQPVHEVMQSKSFLISNIYQCMLDLNMIELL